MKQIGFLEKIATLFEFRTVNDKNGNEFVLFANNTINDICNILISRILIFKIACFYNYRIKKRSFVS